MIGIAETVKSALWFPGRNDDALVGDLWRGNVAYYPMWGGAGIRAMDLSGNGNDGTLTDMDPATDWVPTEMGMALDLDGGDDYVSIPDHTSLRGMPQLTVATWFNSKQVYAFDNDFELVSKMDFAGGARYYYYRMHYVAGTGDDKYMKCSISTASGSGNSASVPIGTADHGFTADTWYHMALTYDGAVLKLFWNGLYAGETAHSGAINNDAQNVPVLFGSWMGDTFFFDGNLGTVGIWNRALSAGDIAYLAANPFVMIRQPDFTPFWDVSGVAPPSFIPYPRPRGTRGGHSVQTGGLV